MVKVFIDRKFLEQFSKIRPEITDSSADYWRGLKNLITQKKYVIVYDHTGKEIKKDDINRVFFDQHNLPPQQFVNFNKLNIESISENPVSICFFDLPYDEIENYKSKYGICFSNLDLSVKTWEIISCKNNYKILIKNKDWVNKLKPLKFPYNSLIIIDKFLLAISENDIENILIPCLQKSFFYSQEVDKYYITIYCSDQIGSSIKIKPQLLHDLIKNSKLKDYNIYLQIIVFSDTIDNTSKELHNRKIFTNYFEIASQDSFFKDTGDLDINPFIDEEIYDSLYTKLKNLESIMSDPNKSKNIKKIGDEFINPLFKIIHQ